MTKIHSKIDTGSPDFQKNKIAYQLLLNQFYQRMEHVTNRQNEDPVKKHKSKGRMTARERIDALMDREIGFLELSPLAAYGLKNNEFPSAGIITGIGQVHGKDVVVIANDATVKGGTYIQTTIKKHIRAQEIALECHLPCIYLVDSGGIFLPDQAEVFADRYHFGRFFYNQARMSALGLPQIAVVMGSCTAGGAYVPAMSDEVIMVKNQGTIFIGGPPLVKAATGEDVTPEELGGAEMHTSKSGVADYLADNDQHALEICRNIFRNLSIPQQKEKNAEEIHVPVYPIEDLYGIVNQDLKRIIDAREIIARIVDGSEFHEFKERYGRTLVTGFARILGYQVGIIANNGILFSESALKGAHFIELCASRQIPLIFLQNIMGFMVGKRSEQGGLAKDGAKMIHAVANANVPKITLVFGGSFGAGNYAMAGRGYDPDFLFMWPNGKISVMGGEQASNVLAQVKTDQYHKRKQAPPQEEIMTLKKEILEKYNEESSCYYSTARLWDDGIIDPVDTRKILGRCLEIVRNKPSRQTRFGIFRM